MDLQGRVLLSLALLSVAVIAIFVLIAVRSRGPVQTQDAVQGPGYAIRRWWLLFLAAILALAFGASIPFYPYSTADSGGEAVEYTVIAQQFSFNNLPQEVPYGTPVVFNVTSSDVTHGFAVYDPQERLVGQVQAMPEYDNQLRITFTERGRYTVRCLEYCGLAHHLMEGGFEVK